MVLRESAIVTRKVIIHIGTHKTGSTSIQSTFGPVASGPVQYAQLGDPNQSLAIVNGFCDLTIDHPQFRHAEVTRADIKRKQSETRVLLQAALNKDDAETIVISGEAISTMCSKALSNLREFVEREHCEIEILCYVRAPLEYMPSRLQEQIKHNDSPQSAEWPNYRGLLRNFHSVFGSERVRLREYSRAKFPQGSVLLDFAAATGLPAPEDPMREVNTFRSSATSKFIYRLNHSQMQTGGSPAHIRGRFLLGDLINRVLPGERYFPNGDFLALWDQDDCDWLESVSGIRFERPADIEVDSTPLHEYLWDIRPEECEQIAFLLDARKVVPLDRADPQKLVEQLYEWCYKRILGIIEANG